MAPLNTLVGSWIGGPHGGKVEISNGSDGATATFKCPKNGGVFVSVIGVFMEGGKKLKGKMTHSCDGGAKQVLITLDSSGDSWTANVVDGPTWRGSKAVWKLSSSQKQEEPVPGDKRAETWKRLQASLNRDERAAKAKQAWDEQASISALNHIAREQSLFGLPLPNTVGDDFDHTTSDSRWKGRGMHVPASKSDHCFGELNPNAIGDPYKSSFELGRSFATAKAKKLKDKAPFRPASAGLPNRRDIFLLDIDSNASPDELKKTLLAERAAEAARRKAIEHPPRNIMTSPPKKGQLLAHLTEQGRGTLAYVESPYDLPVQKAKAERKQHTDAMKDRPAFRPGSHGHGTFQSDTDVHREMGPGVPAVNKFRELSKLPDGQPPFRPPQNLHKYRENATFSPLPPYLPDPLPVPVLGARTESEHKWTPPDITHSIITPSVALHRTNIRVQARRIGARI